MQQGKNNTILYVDDDLDDLQLLNDAIKKIDQNYIIEEAHDGVEAMDMLEKMKHNGKLPCLIILDINMPKMDGKQTLVAIQNDEILSSIPVLIFSTSSSVLDKVFFEKKHVAFITKPVDFHHFVKVASDLLSYCKT